MFVDFWKGVFEEYMRASLSRKKGGYCTIQKKPFLLLKGGPPTEVKTLKENVRIHKY